MNYNMTLTCNVCKLDTNCRVGLSNREIQPLSFACPHCAALIHITLELGKGLELSGAEQLAEKKGTFFGSSNPFRDLHLDFPVWLNDYVPGMTPFMVAMMKINRESHDDKHQLIALHAQRLHQLNHLHQKSQQIRTILKLYNGHNKQLFKEQVEKFLNADLGPSLKPQDINAALYLFVSFVIKPFVHHDEVIELVNGFTQLVFDLSQRRGEAFNAFMKHMMETKFLHSIQKDCLDLYPEIYEAELPLRPALFLDLVEGYEQNKVAIRVSNQEFKTYKDIYKDVTEVFGRQLILIAAINNIIHRDGHDNFAKPADGKALSSLDKFADKTLSDKFKYLDDCWYEIDNGIVNTSIRNAIAHFTAEYDEVSQIITYFPEKEGVRQEKGETMFFLDFMRMLLLLFREVHCLHHLIKALFYYEYLIRNKK